MLRGLPEVETAACASFRGVTVARPATPDQTVYATSTIVLDEGLASIEGEQILVAGRWLSPHAVDEIVANERFITKIGVAVGDEIEVTFWAPDEIGRVTADGDQLHGPSARVRIVGVVRGLLDLAASSQQFSEAEFDRRSHVRGDPHEHRWVRRSRDPGAQR